MKSVLFYTALLSAAMVGSYVSWTSESTETRAADAVAVYRASEGDVLGLAYTSEDLDVTLERKTDERGDYAWVTVTERKKKPLPPEPVDPEAPAGPETPDDGDPDAEDAPDDGDPDAEDAPDAALDVEERFTVEVVEQAFTGSDKALDLLADFEPLQAKRQLDAALATTPSFGFEEPSGQITVKRRKGQEETLVVGGSTYGSKDRYVKHDAELFLVEDTAIRPLQFAATRLRERQPHPWTEADVETLSITYDGQAVSYEQKNRDDRARSFWVRSGEESADDNAAGLIERILRLKASNGTVQPEGELKPLAEVTLTQGKEEWRVVLAADDSEKGRFLTSDFLRGTVPVRPSAADEILDDLTELLAP